MKQLITCLLISLIIVSGQSQTFERYLKDVSDPCSLWKERFHSSHHNSKDKANAKKRLSGNYLLRLDSIITYNSSDQILSLYQWIYSDDIISSERILFNYADEHTLTPAGKRSRIYDSDKLLTTEYYIEWLSDRQKWDTLTREVYYYDSTGLLLKIESSLAPDWYLYLQREFVYNTDGLLVSEVIYSNQSDWEQTFRIEYTYQNSLQHKEDTYEWSSDGWMHIHQILYTYDDYENPVEQLFFHREQYAGDELIPYRKTFLKYDLTVTKDMLIMDIGFPFNHKLTEMTNMKYQKSANQWVLTSTSIPYYSEVNNPVTTLLTTNQNPFFDIYPNPFDNTITIATNSYTPILLEVFNPLGTRIISSYIDNYQTLPTKQLPAGSYICVLYTTNGKFFKRLIKNN